jgi:DNA-binding transcriptional LysR family regulator
MATFAAVVDNDGFSKAADALNMSKSSVSRRVAALEKRLAIKLMNRTTRSLTLTESGRLYYDYCAQLVSNAEEADAAVKHMQSVPSGTLNLSLPETLGRASILPLLPIFLKQHPDIRLNLTITSRKVDLGEERIDVAVRKGVIEDDSLMAVPLGSSTQLLYASTAFLDEIPPLKTEHDLANHPYLTSQISAGPLVVKLWRGLMETHVKVEPRLAVKDHEALLKMTLAGLGIALLPVWMAKRYEDTGELRQVLPELTGPSVDFNIVYQPHRGFSPVVRAFVEFLPKQLADVGPSIGN